MTEAFIIRARVKYTAGNDGNIEYLVLARNSQQAVKILLNSPKFPSAVTVKIITIENYNGELVMDRNLV